MHRSIRHILAAGALALIATAPMAACGADPVSPLPVQAASASPLAPTTTPAATPKASSPPVVRPAKTKPVRPTSRPTSRPTGTCFGAVRHDVDLHNTVLDLIRSMCFRTGGVLRLQGIGPGLVTATPESLVSQSYEAGVVDLRFVRPGTVTVTIPMDEKTYTITVVVIR